LHHSKTQSVAVVVAAEVVTVQILLEMPVEVLAD
jgi:hypothetical protein